MKKILSVLFVLIVFNASAQNDTTKNTRKALIDTVCVCAGKQDTASIKSKDDLQNVVMKCFMQRMDMFLQAMQEENVDLTDAEAQKQFGQQLGLELVMQCPVLMQLSVKIAAQEMAAGVKTETKKSPAAKPKATYKPSPAKPKTTAKPKG